MSRIDKRFEDDLSTAVITTRFVFKDNKPITSVFHHEVDGMWEFIGDDKCADDRDYLIVSLEEMIKIDQSILKISDLPLGMSANRENADAPWIIE